MSVPDSAQHSPRGLSEGSADKLWSLLFPWVSGISLGCWRPPYLVLNY